ncbi:MAG: hypothetical protein ACYDH6_03465 [Acidimicrobiales bacterium]
MRSVRLFVASAVAAVGLVLAAPAPAQAASGPTITNGMPILTVCITIIELHNFKTCINI